MKKIVLKKDRDKSLLRWHPWVFSGAIARIEGKPEPGETVAVADHKNNVLALAAFSPHSQIQARVWTFDTNEKIDKDFFQRRLKQSIERRKTIYGRSAYRLVYGESDGLPGLIVDRYCDLQQGDFLVCQFLTAGMEAWRDTIVELLSNLVDCTGLYERSDSSNREKEGLQQRQGLLRGKEPLESIVIEEFNLKLLVSIQTGHKTGYYLDQADNRNYLQTISNNKTVLNCFSYTGGFGVAALKGGARYVVNADSSAPALQIATQNMQFNGFDQSQFENVTANIFELLREYKRDHKQFDIVVLDPPKLAETKTQQQKAARAYKDLALQAASIIAPGGYLINFSCSGAIDVNLFQKITADAFLDAKRQGQVIRYLHQAEDHPVALPFPESLYLKGLVCRAD